MKTSNSVPGPAAVESAARIREMTVLPPGDHLEPGVLLAWYCDRPGSVLRHAWVLAGEIERMTGARW